MTTVCPICNSSAQELPRTGDATGFHSPATGVVDSSHREVADD